MDPGRSQTLLDAQKAVCCSPGLQAVATVALVLYTQGAIAFHAPGGGYLRRANDRVCTGLALADREGSGV